MISVLPTDLFTKSIFAFLSATNRRRRGSSACETAHCGWIPDNEYVENPQTGHFPGLGQGFSGSGFLLLCILPSGGMQERGSRLRHIDAQSREQFANFYRVLALKGLVCGFSRFLRFDSVQSFTDNDTSS